MKSNFLPGLFFFINVICPVKFVISQQPVEWKYPQGYFRDPLGIPISLAANFGELRPSHWHMGLDIRTNQKENYSVYAAADGYVAYVGIRPLSFGKFIVVRHANGYSTLYAHLNSYYPELETYVRKKQYQDESWTQEIEFPENLFPVKKGQQIAWSGNTGGSQGPHLHFEIRNTKTGHCLNPLLFGLDIADPTPPVINRIAIYNRDRSTYLQSPVMIRTVKTGSKYFTNPRKIQVGYKKLSFALGAIDRINGSGADGIYRADLFFDNQTVIQYRIDDIDYDQTHYVDAHIDMKVKNGGGPYLQHLSLLPGFQGTVYKNIRNNGIVELNDTVVHSIRIKVFDANGNSSELFFEIQYNDRLAKNADPFPSDELFAPGLVNVKEEKDFEVYMPEDCLYDTVAVCYSLQNIFPSGAVSPEHQFGDPVYPVHSAFSVRIKPTVPMGAESKNKLLMVHTWKGKMTAKKAEWGHVNNGDDWLSARFNEFGNFQLITDLQPPEINAPAKGKDTLNLSALDKIVFIPTDNFGIQSFRAELDGKWLMFSNDKTKRYVYNFDEHCPYGVHELKVRVEDLVGNVTEKKWIFKRYSYTPPPKKKTAVRSKGKHKTKTSSKKK